MLKFKELATKEIGFSEYTDSKFCTHKIKHSVIISEYEKREVEEKIAGELYQIFEGCTSCFYNN